MVPKFNGLMVALMAGKLLAPFFKGVPSKLEHAEYGDPLTGSCSFKSFPNASGISGRSLGRASTVSYMKS